MSYAKRKTGGDAFREGKSRFHTKESKYQVRYHVNKGSFRLKQLLLPADQVPSTDNVTPVSQSRCLCRLSAGSCRGWIWRGYTEPSPVTLRPGGVFLSVPWRLNNFTSLFLWLSEDLEVYSKAHVLLENEWVDDGRENSLVGNMPSSRLSELKTGLGWGQIPVWLSSAGLWFCVFLACICFHQLKHRIIFCSFFFPVRE